MSRVIDLDRKLSDEDREYLVHRGRHADVQANDVQFAGAEPDKAPPGALGTEPSLQSDRVPEAGSDEELVYEDMTVAQLKEEIDARNEERDSDSQLSKSGAKADLIAELEADDEESE